MDPSMIDQSQFLKQVRERAQVVSKNARPQPKDVAENISKFEEEGDEEMKDYLAVIRGEESEMMETKQEEKLASEELPDLDFFASNVGRTNQLDFTKEKFKAGLAQRRIQKRRRPQSWAWSATTENTKVAIEEVKGPSEPMINLTIKMEDEEKIEEAPKKVLRPQNRFSSPIFSSKLMSDLGNALKKKSPLAREVNEPKAAAKPKRPISPAKAERPLSPSKREHPIPPPKQERPLSPPKQERPLSPPKQERPLSQPKQERPLSPSSPREQPTTKVASQTQTSRRSPVGTSRPESPQQQQTQATGRPESPRDVSLVLVTENELFGKKSSPIFQRRKQDESLNRFETESAKTQNRFPADDDDDDQFEFDVDAIMGSAPSISTVQAQERDGPSQIAENPFKIPRSSTEVNTSKTNRPKAPLPKPKPKPKGGPSAAMLVKTTAMANQTKAVKEEERVIPKPKPSWLEELDKKRRETWGASTAKETLAPSDVKTEMKEEAGEKEGLPSWMKKEVESHEERVKSFSSIDKEPITPLREDIDKKIREEKAKVKETKLPSWLQELNKRKQKEPTDEKSSIEKTNVKLESDLKGNFDYRSHERPKKGNRKVEDKEKVASISEIKEKFDMKKAVKTPELQRDIKKENLDHVEGKVVITKEKGKIGDESKLTKQENVLESKQSALLFGTDNTESKMDIVDDNEDNKIVDNSRIDTAEVKHSGNQESSNTEVTGFEAVLDIDEEVSKDDSSKGFDQPMETNDVVFPTKEIGVHSKIELINSSVADEGKGSLIDIDEINVKLPVEDTKTQIDTAIESSVEITEVENSEQLPQTATEPVNSETFEINFDPINASTTSRKPISPVLDVAMSAENPKEDNETATQTTVPTTTTTIEPVLSHTISTEPILSSKDTADLSPVGKSIASLTKKPFVLPKGKAKILPGQEGFTDSVNSEKSPIQSRTPTPPIVQTDTRSPRDSPSPLFGISDQDKRQPSLFSRSDTPSPSRGSPTPLISSPAQLKKTILPDVQGILDRQSPVLFEKKETILPEALPSISGVTSIESKIEESRVSPELEDSRLRSESNSSREDMPKPLRGKLVRVNSFEQGALSKPKMSSETKRGVKQDAKEEQRRPVDKVEVVGDKANVLEVSDGKGADEKQVEKSNETKDSVSKNELIKDEGNNAEVNGKQDDREESVTAIEANKENSSTTKLELKTITPDVIKLENKEEGKKSIPEKKKPPPPKPKPKPKMRVPLPKRPSVKETMNKETNELTEKENLKNIEKTRKELKSDSGDDQAKLASGGVESKKSEDVGKVDVGKVQMRPKVPGKPTARRPTSMIDSFSSLQNESSESRGRKLSQSRISSGLHYSAELDRKQGSCWFKGALNKDAGKNLDDYDDVPAWKKQLMTRLKSAESSSSRKAFLQKSASTEETTEDSVFRNRTVANPEIVTRFNRSAKPAAGVIAEEKSDEKEENETEKVPAFMREFAAKRQAKGRRDSRADESLSPRETTKKEVETVKEISHGQDWV